MTHAKVDFNDPQVADNFKQNFNLSCIGNYQKRAKQAGGTVSGDLMARVEKACSCARDGVIAALAKRAPMTVMEIADVMKSDPELNAITQTCSTQSGIENPT
jgi:hypothetical protein